MKPEAPLFSDEFLLILNGNYEIQDCCLGAEAFFGRELLNKNFLELFDPEHAPIFQKILQELKTGLSQEFELPVQWKQPNLRPFRWRAVRKVKGPVELVHVLGRDLLEHNQKTIDAQKNLDRLNLALSANGTGIWESNHNRTELIWDEQMYLIHGLNPGDYETKADLHIAAYSMLVAEDQETNRTEILKLRAEKKELNVRYRIHHPSGELRYIRAIGRPISKNGEQSYFGIAWDETEAFKNRNLQREQEAKMLASAKMAALGEMSGGIAHEINNPLTVIQARAFQLQQIADNGPISPEKIHQAADSISKTADKIARIIRSLRAFAREGDTDAFDVVSVKQILDETLEFCSSRFANSGVDVQTPPFPQLEFEGRRIQIEQILMNLLNNSFDALQTLRQKWIRLEVYDHGENFEIHVVDSGSGIPADVAEKIMLPFFSTKEVGRGMGLGLSISTSLAKNHQGELYYDAKSENTRFVLRLPKFQK